MVPAAIGPGGGRLSLETRRLLFPTTGCGIQPSTGCRFNAFEKETSHVKEARGKGRGRHRASKGIGAAIARHLAAEGAAVVVNYASSKEGADRVVAEIAGKGGKAVAVQANVAKPDDIRRLFAETKKAFGRLDVLVNNAGVYEFAPLEEITPEHFHKQFDLNVLGLILATQEAVKHFGPDGGSVVNISSVVATSPRRPPRSTAPPRRPWTPSRGRWPRNWAAQDPRQLDQPRHGRDGRGRTAGIAESDMRKKTEAQNAARPHRPAAGHRPGGRFLASSDSGWMTGETLYVAGGYR